MNFWERFVYRYTTTILYVIRLILRAAIIPDHHHWSRGRVRLVCVLAGTRCTGFLSRRATCVFQPARDTSGVADPLPHYPPPVNDRDFYERVMRVRHWLRYYKWPYDGQKEFYAAVCRASALDDLPPEYQQAIEEAEVGWQEERAHGKERAFLLVALPTSALLTAALGAFAFYALASQALTPVPADYERSWGDDVVSPLFIALVIPAVLLVKLTAAIYYGLWPERKLS
jgi:hypothetical protein